VSYYSSLKAGIETVLLSEIPSYAEATQEVHMDGRDDVTRFSPLPAGFLGLFTRVPIQVFVAYDHYRYQHSSERND
jgi:hypothetical protein